MRNFFISHTHDDAAYANWLAGSFQAAGINYWIKPNRRNGRDYYDLLDQQMAAATDLIVIHSQYSAGTIEVYEELRAARLDGKKITIIRVDDTPPPEHWQSLLPSNAFTAVDQDDFSEVEQLIRIIDHEAIPRMEDRTPIDLPADPDDPVFRMIEFGEEMVDEAAMGGSGDPVQFTTYHPKEIQPGKWYKLLSYVHLPGAVEAVKADSASLLGDDAKNFGAGRGEATETILREAEITVVPEMTGCRFNPPRVSLLWLEDWHRADFRMQANPIDPEFVLDTAVNGRVSFYVGPVLVAETKIWAHISDTADDDLIEKPDTASTADPYRDIFISYSHKDTAIVEQVEKAIATLGDKLLRDAHDLRSGQDWNAALLDMIEAADVFQLFWSHNAKASKYVEQEWRHALAQNKPFFIRPIFWEDPMPTPPPELSYIHFDEYES